MFDAIVVGARCAGASTACLLARRGYRVLLIDKARFPSDTVSTLYIQPIGTDCLSRWGLLDSVARSGAPAIRRWSWFADDVALQGFPRSPQPDLPGYAPRRYLLDDILLEAARKASVEVREGFTFDSLLTDAGAVVGIRGHGRGSTDPIDERASIVIGADGRQSSVARALEPPAYAERETLTCVYYAFYNHLPCSDLEQYARRGKGVTLIPTNQGLTLVAFMIPVARFLEVKGDPVRACAQIVSDMGDLADRLASATLAEPFTGIANIPNRFRKSYGPGWALVGDAAHSRDPITGHGISDAFRDAELLANGVDAWLSGGTNFEDALGRYQQRRDATSLRPYEWTLRVAELRPLSKRLASVLRGIQHDPGLVSQFLGLNAGTVEADQFFSSPPIAALMASASGNGAP